MPSVDADVVTFNIYTPSIYIKSDLNDPHMGWIENDNNESSEYHFVVDGDSLRFNINRDFSKMKYLEKGEASIQGKQVSVGIHNNDDFSFRVYN